MFNSPEKGAINSHDSAIETPLKREKPIPHLSLVILCIMAYFEEDADILLPVVKVDQLFKANKYFLTVRNIYEELCVCNIGINISLIISLLIQIRYTPDRQIIMFLRIEKNILMGFVWPFSSMCTSL